MSPEHWWLTMKMCWFSPKTLIFSHWNTDEMSLKQWWLEPETLLNGLWNGCDRRLKQFNWPLKHLISHWNTCDWWNSDDCLSPKLTHFIILPSNVFSQYLAYTPPLLQTFSTEPKNCLCNISTLPLHYAHIISTLAPHYLHTISKLSPHCQHANSKLSPN